MATIREISDRAGVSIATVSKVLNNNRIKTYFINNFNLFY